MTGQHASPQAAGTGPGAGPELRLEDIDVSQGELFQDDAVWPLFARLRDEAPVHLTRSPRYGAFWSITRFEDILEIDTNHEDFSSSDELGGITLWGAPGPKAHFPMFIAMDPPRHTDQRRAVSPAVAPSNLARLQALVQRRAGEILDSLPVGEPFDWVDRVSIELTSQMLATLFDAPLEDRRRFARWSDVTTALPGDGVVDTLEQQQAELRACLDYFGELWERRRASPAGDDLLSLFARNPDTRDMEPRLLRGNILLLLVGGNDTTRNSISGGAVALAGAPDALTALRADPATIDSLVPEIIRWQTPVANMRRTAVRDVDFHGQRIRAGDKVVMWYASGNRDERAFAHPDAFDWRRPNPRRHLAFGFGIHRCVGNRLAELQLRTLWSEFARRFSSIELAAPPRRTRSCMIRGFERVEVVLRR